MAYKSSKQQYLDLYRDNREVLEGHSVATLNACRAAAADVLAATELPLRGYEGYAEADINAMFAPDLGVNIAGVPFRVDPSGAFRCAVPNISTLTGFTANDVFTPGEGLQTRLPEGVTVCPFSQAEEHCPGVLERYYNTVAPAGNPAVALNTLLVRDGVLIHVGRDVQMDKPIQLVNILGGANVDMLAVRRLLIVMEAGSSLRLLVCDHSDDSRANVSDAVVEVDLGPGARLEYYDFEESSAQTSRYSNIAVRQDAASHLDMNVSTLRCGTTRNEITVSLDGEGAECNLGGMAISDGSQRADTSSTVLHNAPYCTSNQKFKYIVDENGRGAFEGLIRVAEGAHHTEAYQNNRNILAAGTAKMHTQPQLEIYCDDVKCSHGAATGQIDARALFYMESRGIPKAEARTMLMQAFMADVIDGISLEALRDRLRHLVELRLSGIHAGCSTCTPVNCNNDIKND